MLLPLFPAAELEAIPRLLPAAGANVGPVVVLAVFDVVVAAHVVSFFFLRGDVELGDTFGLLLDFWDDGDE